MNFKLNASSVTRNLKIATPTAGCGAARGVPPVDRGPVARANRGPAPSSIHYDRGGRAVQWPLPLPLPFTLPTSIAAGATVAAAPPQAAEQGREFKYENDSAPLHLLRCRH